MRLLTVTHFFENHGGGIERVAGHLCRNLAALGHECAWAASAADPAPEGPAISALPLKCINPTERLTGLPMPIPGPSDLAALSRAIDRADAIIVHDALYCTSIAAMMIARVKHKPVILFQHIAAIEFASAAMRKLMMVANAIVTRPMLAAADQVVFISATVRQAFAETRVKRPARLLFNGVDGTIFHAGTGVRGRFGLPETGKVAAFVGRFVEKKGLSVLKALATSRPDTTLAMVGSGPLNPAQWNLRNVRVLGTQSHHDVAELFRTVDFLLLPSVGEGYPLVIQEAMACGLPVICGAESARADPVATHWLQGVDVDLADPSTTATRISALLDRPQPGTDDRLAMASYAASAYSWPGMASEIADIAATLITGNLARDT